MNTTPNATCITFKATLPNVLKAFYPHSRTNAVKQFDDPSEQQALTSSGAMIRRLFVDSDHYKISGYDWEGADVLESLAAILRPS